MQLVYETIVAASKDSSKIAKLAILRDQINNEDLKEFLRVTYEPRINFYMTKVEPEFVGTSLFDAVDHPTATEFTLEVLGDIVSKIANRKLTGHAAKTYIASLYANFTSVEDRNLLEFLIQRDCRAGFSESTINKIWPGLVTDVPYMRCSLPKDLKKTDKLENWPWAGGVFSELKADGMFATVSHQLKTGRVTIESRNGSPFPLDHFGDIVSEVKDNVPYGHQIHGELLVRRGGVILPRQVGNGILNKVLQGGVFAPGDVPTFQAWDIIPNTAALPKGSYNVPYRERLSELEQYLEETKNIRVVDYKIVYSLKEAYAHCKEMQLNGFEGTVIKHPEMIWKDGDSKGQVKLKLTFDVDLVMRRLKDADHKSKHVNTFGSIDCETSDGLLLVSVTGIPDDMRQDIFDNWETKYKDRIMSVSCNGVMEPSDNNPNYSLFLPRRNAKILELPRLDKTVADTLEQVLKLQANAIDMADVIG